MLIRDTVLEREKEEIMRFLKREIRKGRRTDCVSSPWPRG